MSAAGSSDELSLGSLVVVQRNRLCLGSGMRDHDRMDARFLGITDLVQAPSVAVVVDVMRAFTVAAWAFAQGAEKIVLAESLDEAMALKDRHADWVALKDGPPVPGFDTVNSPGLLRSIDLCAVRQLRGGGGNGSASADARWRPRHVRGHRRGVARCRRVGGRCASRSSS